MFVRVNYGPSGYREDYEKAISELNSDEHMIIIEGMKQKADEIS